MNMAENMNEAILGAISQTLAMFEKRFRSDNCDPRMKFGLLHTIIGLRYERDQMLHRLIDHDN